MIRYYCSGFDTTNAFGHGLGEMFKKELKDTKSILYIPSSFETLDKVKTKYMPEFIEHFKKVGINFDKINLITPDVSSEDAKEMIRNASFVLLMGGNPFKQREICIKLDIIEELKKYNGVMLGISAGAMMMSKYIIVTPCSEEYPDFHIEEGLNLDDISIYPHNNTSSNIYPDTLVVGDETYQKEDFIKVAKEYGNFYLLQDNLREDGTTDVSLIKSINGNLEYYTENEGKIWCVSPTNVFLENINNNAF